MVPLHKSSADYKLRWNASIPLDGRRSGVEGIDSRLTSGYCAMSSGSSYAWYHTTLHQAGLFVSISEERSSDRLSGLLMVLFDTYTPAPQCNRRNGAVFIGVRLARHGLPCLERSLTCLVSAFFLTSLLMTVWLMSKLTPIFLQDISAPCIPNICYRTFSGVLRLGISKFVVTISNLLSTYESQEFAFTILRFSSLYLIARVGEDACIVWIFVWISRCPCSN